MIVPNGPERLRAALEQHGAESLYPTLERACIIAGCAHPNVLEHPDGYTAWCSLCGAMRSSEGAWVRPGGVLALREAVGLP